MKKIASLMIITLSLFTLAACEEEGDEITFEILNRRDDEAVVASFNSGQWQGALPPVSEGQSLSLGATITGEDGMAVELDSNGSENGFSVSLAEGAQEDVVELDQHGDHVHVIGVSEGNTQVVFNWTQGGEVRYSTSPIDVEVTQADDDYDASVETFEILNRRDDEAVVAYIHDDHWHGSLPSVEVGASLSLGLNLVDEDGNARELDSDGSHNGFEVELFEHGQQGIVELDNHGDHVHIIGVSPGTTQVVFHWTHDGEVRYTSPMINVEVVESEGDNTDHGHHDDDHDHHDDDHDHDHDHDAAVDTFEILNRRDDENIVAYIHDNHWHGSLPNVPVGESLSLGLNLVDEDGNERTLDSDGSHNGFKVTLYEHGQEGIVELDTHGDHVHIIGESAGVTQVVFHWTHDGEVRYSTPPINVEVVE